LVGVGFAYLFADGSADAYLGAMEEYEAASPEEQQAMGQELSQWDPTSTSLQSIIFAQLAIGVLGVLVATSEYATGMIRASLVAVPRRGRLLVCVCRTTHRSPRRSSMAVPRPTWSRIRPW
jgi:ABC-2 type transport system permease protein